MRCFLPMRFRMGLQSERMKGFAAHLYIGTRLGLLARGFTMCHLLGFWNGLQMSNGRSFSRFHQEGRLNKNFQTLCPT